MRVAAPAVATDVLIPSTALAQSGPVSVTNVPQPQPAAPKPEEAPQKEDLEKILKKMNETAAALGHSLRFEMINHGRMVIRVVDDKTGETIRQFPPEALVKAYRDMEDTMGLLVNERV